MLPTNANAYFFSSVTQLPHNCCFSADLAFACTYTLLQEVQRLLGIILAYSWVQKKRIFFTKSEEGGKDDNWTLLEHSSIANKEKVKKKKG